MAWQGTTPQFGSVHLDEEGTRLVFRPSGVDTKPYDAGQGWSVLVTEKQGLIPAISLHI